MEVLSAYYGLEFELERALNEHKDLNGDLLAAYLKAKARIKAVREQSDI